MSKFTVATYNVNSIRSRLHIVLPWLKKNKPDVLCMQETRVDDDKFPKEEFITIGYHLLVSGGTKGRNGVAVVSLGEPDEYELGFPEQPKDRDRLIKAKFPQVTIVNAYVPQGYKIDNPKYQYKLEWFNRLGRFFEKHCPMSGNLLWCGDMNVAPEDIDVHNPSGLRNHVCFHEAAKNAFRQVKSKGFTDIFRKHHPNEPGMYTFFDYRARDSVERNLGWRVDQILWTKLAAEKSIDCFIDMKPRLEDKPSDHTLLVAKFDL
jgi:exodeoxyribonuclease-3